MRIMKDAVWTAGVPRELWTAGVPPALWSVGVTPAKGFALILSLLLVMILTIFAYWMLLLVQNHYSATKTLFDSDNARTISEAAALRLVQQHNTEVPRFFTDPQNWNQLQMQPFTWNDYAFTGSLPTPWDPVTVNLFIFRGQKARSLAEMKLPLRQIRIEDFALFTSVQQHLTTSTLFDGLVFVRSGLTLDNPALFRGHVHNEVFPDHLATYRRKTSPMIDFSSLDAIFPAGWESAGFVITGKDSRFWVVDHYELDLDQLQINSSGGSWKVKYKTSDLGKAAELILAFDDTVQLRQTYHELPHLPSSKTDAPLYIASSADMFVDSDIQRFEGSKNVHRLCLIAAETIHVQPENESARIEACLLSNDVHVNTGAVPLTDQEKQGWTSEINGSAFLIEPAKKAEFLAALDQGQKTVWFRGTVGINGALNVAAEVTQLHFEASRKIYPILISFPFVQVVEGMEKWL